MSLISRGFGVLQRIITRGFFSKEQSEPVLFQTVSINYTEQHTEINYIKQNTLIDYIEQPTLINYELKR